MEQLERARILPEPELPAVAGLVAAGRQLAASVRVGPCPFLTEWGVASEADYKRRRMAEGTLMLHAQVGYRSPEKTRRAFAEIHQRLAAAGYRVDRYGICLDWSMAYPAAQRAHMPRGTGLILDRPGDFAALTGMAPVAPHFGDFVIGTPAALENTAAALLAGATTIGNLGQYFTFRMPRWNDDVGTTAETVKAIALCAAQPVEVLVHSNLDDGFAALFCDLACGIGAALEIGMTRTAPAGATTVAALEAQGQGLAAALPAADPEALRGAGLKACVTCTDVHEYGKILVETVLAAVGVAVCDAGVSAEPEEVARRAQAERADLIAISTFNGVALGFLASLRRELTRLGLELPVFIGGKLNQVPEDSADSLPVDVSAELEALGARVCLRVEELLPALAALARERRP